MSAQPESGGVVVIIHTAAWVRDHDDSADLLAP